MAPKKETDKEKEKVALAKKAEAEKKKKEAKKKKLPQSFLKGTTSYCLLLLDLDCF